jgi:hypothetical protein
MAEDQGVNGDLWTDQASRLLEKANWQKIGDSNIDILDISGKARGVDALFSYDDGLTASIKRLVFVEAKSWATTSLTEKKLHDWIDKLSDKISSLKNSPGLLDTYQSTQTLEISTGLIACYFNDAEKYPAFKATFQKWLQSHRVPHGQAERRYHPRVFVLDNGGLLWLAAILTTIKDWLNSKLPGEERSVDFYYPSSNLHGNPVQRLKNLNVEYIFSSLVLAKGTSCIPAANQINETDFAFYNGPLDEKSFDRLASALQVSNMVEARNDLVIYKYRRETEEFRKIKPNVEALFQGLGAKSVSIKDMDISNVMPGWVLNGE